MAIYTGFWSARTSIYNRKSLSGASKSPKFSPAASMVRKNSRFAKILRGEKNSGVMQYPDSKVRTLINYERLHEDTRTWPGENHTVMPKKYWLTSQCFPEQIQRKLSQYFLRITVPKESAASWSWPVLCQARFRVSFGNKNVEILYLEKVKNKQNWQNYFNMKQEIG